MVSSPGFHLGGNQQRTFAVEVKGLRFPKLCASCGGPGEVPIVVEKAFISHYEGETTFQIASFAPAFCIACRDRHRSELKPQDFSLLFRRLRKQWQLSVAILANGSFALFFLGKVEPGSLYEGQSLGPFIAFAIFSGIALLCFWSALSSTRYMAVPEPTSVTKSVDFTEDLSNMFEPAWRRFSFEDPAYAALFGDLNRERLWKSSGDKSRKAARRRRAFWFALAAIGVAVVIGSVAEDFYQWWDNTMLWLRGD